MNTSVSNPLVGAQDAILATNKVIRNTYMLLSATLLFSALTASISMAMNLPHPGLLLTLVGYFGLLFLTAKFRNSAAGLGFVFALTGFMGFTLGPIMNAYLALPNGGQIVMTETTRQRLTGVHIDAAQDPDAIYSDAPPTVMLDAVQRFAEKITPKSPPPT